MDVFESVSQRCCFQAHVYSNIVCVCVCVCVRWCVCALLPDKSLPSLPCPPHVSLDPCAPLVSLHLCQSWHFKKRYSCWFIFFFSLISSLSAQLCQSPEPAGGEAQPPPATPREVLGSRLTADRLGGSAQVGAHAGGSSFSSLSFSLSVSLSLSPLSAPSLPVLGATSVALSLPLSLPLSLSLSLIDTQLSAMPWSIQKISVCVWCR